MSNIYCLFNQADIWLMKKVGFLEVLPLTFNFSLAQTDIGRDWRQGTEEGAGATRGAHHPSNYQIQTSNREPLLFPFHTSSFVKRLNSSAEWRMIVSFVYDKVKLIFHFKIWINSTIYQTVEKIKFLSTEFLFGLNFIVLSKLINMKICQSCLCSSSLLPQSSLPTDAKGPGRLGRGEGGTNFCQNIRKHNGQECFD